MLTTVEGTQDTLSTIIEDSEEEELDELTESMKSEDHRIDMNELTWEKTA